MVDVRLRAAADADLAAILDHGITEFGEAIGTDYVRTFQQAFDLLGRHPQAGAMRLDIEPPVRCLHHRRHRIFYDQDGNTVWIVRILHHARDAESLLRR